MTEFEAQVAAALFDGITKQCGFCQAHADEFAPRVAAAIERAMKSAYQAAGLPTPGFPWPQMEAGARASALTALRGSAPEAPDP